MGGVSEAKQRRNKILNKRVTAQQSLFILLFEALLTLIVAALGKDSLKP